MKLSLCRKQIVSPLAFLSAMTIAYVLLGLYFVGQHLYVGETDTTFFITHVQMILQQGNPAGFLASFFNGRYTENNQTPLFPFIISFFYEPSVAYFIKVKLLNLGLGLVYLYLLYYIVRKEAGELSAAAIVTAFIANDTYMHQASMVSCEPLLMITTTSAIYFLLKGLKDNRYWIAAGFCAGLSYMTKPSGMFIPFGFALFVLYDCRFNILKPVRNKYLWLFACAFILVCLPLLARNIILYKFPFYTMNMDMLALNSTDWHIETMPKFSDISNFSLTHTVARFFKGIATETRILLHALYSFSIHYVPKFLADTTALPAKILAGAVSGIIFAVSIFGFVRSGYERRTKALVICIFIGFFLPLSWYSISSPNRRYLLPVIPFFLFFFVTGAGRLLSSLVEKFPRKELLRYSFTAALLLFSAVYPLARQIPNPMTTYKPEHEYEEIVAFLKANLKADEKYYTVGIHNYTFDLLHADLRDKNSGFEFFPNYDEFRKFSETHTKVRYMLMQAEMYRATRHMFGSSIDFNRTDGLVLKGDIPGWKVVKKDGQKPAEYILFENETPVKGH